MNFKKFIEKIKTRIRERKTWFYVAPERSFVIKGEDSFHDFYEIISNKIDTTFLSNPLAPINRYKKKYKGRINKREFRVRYKAPLYSHNYSFTRINGKFKYRTFEPELDVHVQGLMGKWRAIYFFVLASFNIMYMLGDSQNSHNYDFGFQILINLVLLYIIAIINYGENYKVHNLEKEFIEDVKEWFN